MVLDRDDMMVAVTNGVKEAILTMTESGDGYSGKIIRDPFLNAVESGVYNAMWSLMTNATDMPCTDFYEMIKQGVESALEKR